MAWIGVEPPKVLVEKKTGQLFSVFKMDYQGRSIYRARSCTDNQQIVNINTVVKNNGVRYSVLRMKKQVDTRTNRKRLPRPGYRRPERKLSDSQKEINKIQRRLNKANDKQKLTVFGT